MPRPTHLRVYDPAGTVLASMDLPAFGSVRFAAAEPVGYVVFYSGGLADAAVAGRIDYAEPRRGTLWIDWEGDA